MDIKIFELEKLYIRALNDIIEVKVKKNNKELNDKIKEFKKHKSINFFRQKFYEKKLVAYENNINKENIYYINFFQNVIKKVSDNKFIEDNRKTNDFKISESLFLREISTTNKTIETIILIFNLYYPEYANLKLYQRLSLSSNFMKLYFCIEDFLKYGILLK